LSGRYLTAVFSYGFDADVNARESCFRPTVSAAGADSALVGWPMAYGAATSMLLWLVVALLFLRPCLAFGPGGSAVVAAALAVATLAWFQAVLWFQWAYPACVLCWRPQ